MVKSMKSNHNENSSPTVTGTRVIGGTIGIVLLISIVLFGILLPIILFATYYYTYDLVKFLQENNKCEGCLSGDYMCDQVLKHTPIPLMSIMVINFCINLFKLNVPLGVKLLLALVNCVMFIWFVWCLYKNMNYLTVNTCPCVEERKLVVDRLRMVSKLLFGLLVFSFVAFFLGIIVMCLNRK